MTDIQGLIHYFMENSILFSFRGPLSQDLLEILGNNLSRKLSEANCNQKTAMRIFSVFVEQAQNVIRYSEEKVMDETIGIHEMRTGVFFVRRCKEKFEVLSANLVQQKQVLFLREILDGIKALSPEELAVAYRARRRNPPPPGSKGAGLGFYEMARHSEKLEYYFHEMDPEHSIFIIKAII